MIDDSAGSESGGSDLVLLGPRVPGRVGEPGALLGALVEPLFIANPGNPTAINLPNGVATRVGAITVEVEEYLAGGSSSVRADRPWPRVVCCGPTSGAA